MLHQVVAIGDIHLQSTHPRNGARLAALDQIIREGLALPRLALWALLGDVFHGRSTPQDRNDLATRLQQMAERAPVVILKGNHEAEGDLDIFGELHATWPIDVFDAPEVVGIRTPNQIAFRVAVLPYPHKGQLIANGTAADETLQAAGGHLADIMRGFAADLHDARYPLFLGHVNVAGAVCSNGQPNIGREIELDPGLFDLFAPRIPKILGHVHRAQPIGGGTYVGSVCRLDFNETEEKRYLVIEYLDDPDLFPVFVSSPIDVAPMFLIEGTLSREGFTLAGDTSDEVRARFNRRDWAGAEARVRYAFPASERAVLEQAAVDMVGLFEGAAHLQLEPVAIPDRALRAPEVASAKTLREKVDAWARVNGGRAVPATMCDKLARLEYDEPTQLLSAVANQVAAIETPEVTHAA